MHATIVAFPINDRKSYYSQRRINFPQKNGPDGNPGHVTSAKDYRENPRESNTYFGAMKRTVFSGSTI